FLLTYVALTLLCSTLSRSQVVSGALAFGFLVVLSALGAVPRLGEAMPGSLITWAGSLAAGDGGSAWPAVAVSAGLILLALLVAWLILERQEL
ncbi:MAG: hypothetical protein GWN58_42675, partial [Anaerolineae bacterium]|nr:hypothetical protein [Anaerolineae bacterium]